MHTLSKENQKILTHFLMLQKNEKLEGVYDDVPEEVYNHPDFPGVRSSFLKEVVKRSYYHATLPKPDNVHFKKGRIFHSIMEGIDPGIIQKQYNLIYSELNNYKQMRASIMSHSRFKEVYDGARKEVTMFAKCRYTDLWLRCRCDLWHPETNLVTDYKTTVDASLDGFSRLARKWNYRMSACFYSAVVCWATGRRVDEFRIVAVEKETPFLNAQYSYMSESFELDTELMVQGLNQIKLAQDHKIYGYSENVTELRY